MAGCAGEKKKDNQTHQPKVLEAKGYVVPKDSMAEPKVILVDESKLKKVPVGQPKVVPAHLNVHPVGTPKVVPAGQPRVCTPGRDTFSLPMVDPAICKVAVAKHPKPVPALHCA